MPYERKLFVYGGMVAVASALGYLLWQARQQPKYLLANHGDDHIPITPEFAKALGEQLDVNWSKVKLGQFRRGLEVEQEHLDVTGHDFEKIARIALAHLTNEGDRPDYYDALDRMEQGEC